MGRSRKLLVNVSGRHLRRVAAKTSFSVGGDMFLNAPVPQGCAEELMITNEQCNDSVLENIPTEISDLYDSNLGLEDRPLDIALAIVSNDKPDDQSSLPFVQKCKDEKSLIIRSLSAWVAKFNICLIAFTALLVIISLLRPDLNLPKDARTVLGTPRSTIVREITPGQYWHRGLENGLKKLLVDKTLLSIELSVNIDGLPIAESSTSVLWPILCSVNRKWVFVVGIYHGYEKPLNANLYLQEFVEEANFFIANGLEHNGEKIPVKLEALICDAPAKSFSLGIKSHNSKHGCTKCTVEGEYLNKRVSFVHLDALLRTDASFRAKLDEDFHTHDSVLLSLTGFLPVTMVVLDYMHLVCEGVMKKMIMAWKGGPLNVRLSAAMVSELNAAMENVSIFIPKEFARIARSFRFVKMWKATEFRQFLLYTGPIVMRKILSKPLYEHFLILHVAISVLCSKTFCQSNELVNYAQDLLKIFVEKYMILYGTEFISHNVHGLIHLADDVRNFGHLDGFSAFRFESFLFKLKKLIHKPEKPLQQVMRRYTEREDLFTSEEFSLDNPCLAGKHDCGPIPTGCEGPQYMRANFPTFVLNIADDADRCCILKDNSVLYIENFAHSKDSGQPLLIGRKLKVKGNLYDYPCASSKLGIVVVCGESSLTLRPLSEVKQKCMRLPLKRKTTRNETELAILPFYIRQLNNFCTLTENYHIICKLAGNNFGNPDIHMYMHCRHFLQT